MPRPRTPSPSTSSGKSALGDYMVVTSGRSHRHVGRDRRPPGRRPEEAGFGPVRVEGLPHCDWVLIDAGDLIVHIFRPEVREFYNIEKMWIGGALFGASRAGLTPEREWRSWMLAVGRLKAGPERELCERYLERARKRRAARLGLARLRASQEVAEFARRAGRRTGSPQEEAALLARARSKATGSSAWTQRGELVDSDAFAARSGKAMPPRRSPRMAFVIGGAGRAGGRGVRRARRTPHILRPGDLAASAGASSARRAALPRDDHPFRPPLSSGIMLRLCSGRYWSE